MSLQFIWLRDQRVEAIHERLAHERATKLWRVVWSAVLTLGAVSLGYLLVFSLGSSAESFFSKLNESKLPNLGIWLGLLAALLLGRLAVSSLRRLTPLSETLRKPTTVSIDMSAYFGQAALSAMDRSFLADQVWRPWRLLDELLRTSEVQDFFLRLGADPIELQRRLGLVNLNADISIKASEALFRNIAFKALEACFHHQGDRVHQGDLLEALIIVPSQARDFLIDQGIRDRAVIGVNSWLHYRRYLSRRRDKARALMLYRDKAWRNQLWTSTVTPILDAVGIDLTAIAGGLPPLVDRHDEIKRLFEIYSGESRGALLVGPRGSGKARLIEGLAQKIIANQAPPILQDRRVVTMSIARLLSLSSAKTPLKQVAAQLTREVSRSGNIVIVLEDLASFEAAKTDGAAQLVESLLSDAMKRGQVLLIAAVHTQDLSKLEGPLVSSLTKLEIAPMSEAATLRVLESLVPRLEAIFNVAITYPALERAVELSDQFVHDIVAPGKALRLLTQAAEEQIASQQGKWLTVSGVETFLAHQTGLPLQELTTDEGERLLNLEAQISERYINQVSAVRAVSAAIRRARTSLGSEQRPIANFLFLGPTGVGKTELARRLADVYFGGQGKMVRLDMTEYQEPQSIRNLIGAPVGTGGEHQGHLVVAVRDNPFAVILLDEFEKAHPDILNIFLQVMDDARLSAPDGEVYDFTHTLIIATSNAGSQLIQDALRVGKTHEELTDELKRQELPKYFKPELLNRFDGVIVFEPLKFQHIVEIAKLLIGELADKLAEKEIAFLVTNEALEDIAAAGFEPSLGARPLRRVLQDKVEDEIAKLLLARQVRARDTIILDRNFELRVEQAEHY